MLDTDDVGVIKFFEDVVNDVGFKEVSACAVHEQYAPSLDVSEWLFLINLHYQNNKSISEKVDLRHIEFREKPGFDNWIVTDLVCSRKQG